MRTVLILVLLCSSMSLSAQLLVERQEIPKEPSYFISFDNDTVYGEIRYAKRIFGGILNKIIYTDTEGYDYKLRANESNGFSLNGQNYESKIIDDFYYFLRPAVSGKPALYYLEHNYVKRESVSTEMIRAQGSHGRIIKSYVEMNGRMHKIYRKRFKKQGIALFSSYPEVVEKIFEDELGFFDLEEIVTYCNMMNEGLITSEWTD